MSDVFRDNPRCFNQLSTFVSKWEKMFSGFLYFFLDREVSYKPRVCAGWRHGGPHRADNKLVISVKHCGVNNFARDIHVALSFERARSWQNTFSAGLFVVSRQPQ